MEGKRKLNPNQRPPTSLGSLGETLLRYEDEHRALIEDSPDLVARFDEELRFVYVNAAMAEALGRPAAFFLGRRPTELAGYSASAVEWNERIAQCLRRGTEDSFEFQWDGKTGQGPRIFEARLIPERRREGHSGTVLVVSKDVTAHRAAAAAARDSQQYYGALIADSSDLLAVLDAQAVIQFCSDSSIRLLGRYPEQLVGQSLDHLLHPDDAGPVAAAREAGLRFLGESHRVEARLRHADGAWRQFEVLRKTVRLPSGATIVVLNARDISERRRMEALVQRSQRVAAVGRMADGIAHEFNNFLTTILGTCEVLAHDLPDHPPLREAIGVIRAAGLSAESLTHKLTAFSRHQVLRPERLEVDALITGVEPLLRRVLGGGITLTLELAPGPIIEADRQLLQQALLNLVSSARDRMPGGGNVTITSREMPRSPAASSGLAGAVVNRCVVVTIRDSGLAMDAAAIDRILDPFMSAEAADGADELALVAVHSALEQSSGAMDIDSAPGAGNTVRLYLPATTGEGAGAPTPAPARAPELTPGAAAGWETLVGEETILLVEDEQAIREFMTRFLERLGYHVLAAEDAQSAITASDAFADAIHLVLCDVDLPGMSGPVLVQQLQGGRPDLRVIYVSGYTGDRGAHQPGISADATFLHKPYTVADIGAALRAEFDRPMPSMSAT